MKYSKHLKCLYYIGKCSKYLYYTKKILCVSAFVVAAVLGVSIIFKSSCNCKALKGLI